MQTTTQMGTISKALQNRISREKLQDFLARFGANEDAHFYLISADILLNDVSSEERKKRKSNKRKKTQNLKYFCDAP